MGISRGIIKLLMREGKREKYHGKILCVGRQDIFATENDLKKWAHEMGYKLISDVNMSISNKEDFKLKNHIDDTSLLMSLGFNSVDSIDCNDYEGCTIVHDLNKDIPSELYNKYDLIYDGGTSEHIFNFPKVLENYNKMLKVGGRLIHALPTSNWVDHGFYMFSPILFHDYYSANKWEIIDSLLTKRTPKDKLREVYQYVPGCLKYHSDGRLNKDTYEIFFIARKTPESTYDAPVQQDCYLQQWGVKTVEDPSSLVKNAKRLPVWVKSFIKNQILERLPLRYYLKLIAKY